MDPSAFLSLKSTPDRLPFESNPISIPHPPLRFSSTPAPESLLNILYGTWTVSNTRMSNHGHAEATSIMEETPHGTDGTLGKMMRFRKPKHTVAIFIHAGAGFHSPQNERTHLEACSSYGIP